MNISPGGLSGSSSFNRYSLLLSFSACALPPIVFSASTFCFARRSSAFLFWISRSLFRLAAIAGSSCYRKQSLRKGLHITQASRKQRQIASVL